MKSETLLYGEEVLKHLNGIGDKVSFKLLEPQLIIKGQELRELLKYLVKKDYIKWKSALFVNDTHISDDEITLAHNGMEIILGKKSYFGENEKPIPTIQNQTNISNSSQVQLAQITGNHNKIEQFIDNSKISVLTRLIQDDTELEDEKKKGLLNVLEKFNTLKEGSDNALDLVKKVGSIAAKYVPLFFSLLR